MGWNDHCTMVEIIADEEEANGNPDAYMTAIETVTDLMRDGEHSCARDCR